MCVKIIFVYLLSLCVKYVFLFFYFFFLFFVNWLKRLVHWRRKTLIPLWVSVYFSIYRIRYNWWVSDATIYLYLYIHPSTWLFVCLSQSLSTWSVYISINIYLTVGSNYLSLSVYPSIYMVICMSISISIYFDLFISVYIILLFYIYISPSFYLWIPIYLSFFLNVDLCRKIEKT